MMTSPRLRVSRVSTDRVWKRLLARFARRGGLLRPRVPLVLARRQAFVAAGDGGRTMRGSTQPSWTMHAPLTLHVHLAWPAWLTASRGADRDAGRAAGAGFSGAITTRALRQLAESREPMTGRTQAPTGLARTTSAVPAPSQASAASATATSSAPTPDASSAARAATAGRERWAARTFVSARAGSWGSPVSRPPLTFRATRAGLRSRASAAARIVARHAAPTIVSPRQTEQPAVARRAMTRPLASLVRRTPFAAAAPGADAWPAQDRVAPPSAGGAARIGSPGSGANAGGAFSPGDPLESQPTAAAVMRQRRRDIGDRALSLRAASSTAAPFAGLPGVARTVRRAAALEVPSLAPPVPRTLARAPARPAPADTTASAPAPPSPRMATAASPRPAPPIDVASLSDEVYRQIQRRIRIERERRGL